MTIQSKNFINTLPAGIFTSGFIGRQNSTALTYLLKDLFTSDDAAPLTTPRTCEPGPGTMTVTQPNSQYSISSGSLVDGGGTLNADYIKAGEFTPVAGLWIYCLFSAYSDDFYWIIDDADDPDGITRIETKLTVMEARGFNGVKYGDISANGDAIGNTSYIAVVFISATKYIILLDDRVYFVSDTGSPTKIYNYISGNTASYSITDYRVANLTGDWATDYGIATDRLAGSRSAGNTFSHEANAVIEFVVDTLPSGGQIELWFRKQDASNYWAVTVDSSGEVNLDEVVSGSATQRASLAAGSVANGERIYLWCDDETIKVFGPDGNDTITYTSAANFKTATAGELDTLGTGGAVSDILALPHRPDTTVLDLFEAA